MALRPGLGKFLLLLAFFFLPSVFSLFIFLGFGATNASAASIKLSIPSSALSLDITPGSGAVFKKSSPETITVSTDSLHGYTFSIQSKTGSDLLNGSDKISSISSPLSESDYESSGDSNTWAYLPSKLSGSPNSNFLTAPTLEPTTLDTTDSSSEGTDYSLSLAAKVDNNTPSGSYANTFVLSATSNEPPYEIMQNWEGCDALEEHQTVKLLDTRDNNIYTVAKLKDGKCWMSENLRLGDEKLTDRTLTPDNTNITSNYTLPESSTSGFSDDNAENIYVGAPWNDYTSGYYTWHAATAGTGKSATSQGQNATGSICPKGWRLPTGGTGGELEVMANKYGSSSNGPEWTSAMQSLPTNFFLSGYYASSLFTQGDGQSYWWSSTAGNSTHAYTMLVGSNIVNPTYNYNRMFGWSVRCVSISNNVMQNVEKWADTVQDGETKTAVDIRDGNEYTVARLKDGRFWMTQNLRLGDSKLTNRTLTPNDTNITENYTLPASSTSGFSDDTAENLYVGAPWDNYTTGYYTWCTAVAGTCSSITTWGENATSSICPKGWRLPTGGPGGEFEAMASKYGSSSNGSAWTSALQGSPTKFVLAGWYSNSSFGSSGTNGRCWSSTANGLDAAYDLVVGTVGADPTDPDNRRLGHYIRCVATTDDPINVGIMQTVDQWGDSVGEGETVKATDIRDNKEYTIARLKDGKLWMTQNLSLGDSKLTNRTLTPDDTNIASNYTLPENSTSGFSDNSAQNVYVGAPWNGYTSGYYTWLAATAGTGKSATSQGQNAIGSICPKGWRLPTGGTGGEQEVMSSKYGSSSNQSAWGSAMQAKPAPGFVLSGYCLNSSFLAGGSNSGWWSSTANGSTGAYNLVVYTSSVSPVGNPSHYAGYSIRCISDQ